MATLDFGLLGLNQPNVAERFYQGQQEAQRNLLAQQQLAHAQQQNELARMQMAEYARTREEQNALLGAIAPNFDPTNPEHTAAVMRAAPTLGPKFIESALMTQKTSADIAKTKSDTQTAQLRTLGVGLTNALKNPTDDVLNRTFAALDAQGINTKPFRDQFAAEPDLARRQEIITNYATSHPEGRAALDFVKPKPEKVDLKDRVAFIDMNPNSPTYGQETRAAAAVGRAPQLKTPEEERQAIRIAQASHQPVAPTVSTIVDPTNPNQMITIDARRYTGGGVGSSGVIGVAGKEPSAALRVNKIEEGKTQLQNDLDNLRSSFTELDRLRAIPSTERSVASNLMSAAQASGMGQALGRAGGTKEQVERDVINSARQRLVASIKNATGMSAKSLDSNMELQTMLRSLSDPGQSVEAAMRIINDIEDAYVRNVGKIGAKKPPKPPTADTSSSVRDQADAILRGGK